MTLGLAALPASAHAPPLGARVLSPALPEHSADEVIVTNRGLVFVDPDGVASSLLCNEALRITTAELPNVALLGDGGLIVAASSGLRLSRDRGCTWSDVGPMGTTNTPALAGDPHDPDTVFVANYDSDVPGLRVTRDAGASWSLVLQTEAADYVHSILVSAADAAIIYATLTRYAPAVPPSHSLLRSRDGGQSWDRLSLPLNDRDYRAVAAASSPSDPDVLILYTVANSPGLDDSRLLVSRDGGDSFEVVLERPEIRGVGYGDSGKLWVAARDGLYGANAQLSVFEQTSLASELGCVMERAGSLLVCGHYAGVDAESGIGVSADGGRSFERWLDFSDVEAPVQCPADSLTQALCARPWLDWQTEMSSAPPLAPPSGYGPIGTPGPSAPPLAPAGGGDAPLSSGAFSMGEGLAGDPKAGDAATVGCALGASGRPSAATLALALLVALGLRRRGRRSLAQP